METAGQKIVMIDKEQISNLKFPEKEVLHDAEAIKHRKMDCEKATLLGNAQRNKVKVVFEDSEGLKMVETTIWGTTDKRIILKSGMVIPLHRIHAIKLF